LPDDRGQRSGDDFVVVGDHDRDGAAQESRYDGLVPVPEPSNSVEEEWIVLVVDERLGSRGQPGIASDEPQEDVRIEQDPHW